MFGFFIPFVVQALIERKVRIKMKEQKIEEDEYWKSASQSK